MTIGKLLLGTVCCVGVLIVVSAVAYFSNGGALGRFNRARIATACIQCQGRGFLQNQERTLQFDGSGFADGPPQRVDCPTCNGTGVIYR